MYLNEFKTNVLEHVFLLKIQLNNVLHIIIASLYQLKYTYLKKQPSSATIKSKVILSPFFITAVTNSFFCVEFSSVCKFFV